MPELPEVETVVRDLRPFLVERRILSVRRITSVELRQPWQSNWEKELLDQRIVAINRRGKWIVIHLLGGGVLLVHLGMTGRLTLEPVSNPAAEHTHLVFELDTPELELRYNDIRRFGCALFIASQAELDTFFMEQGLGPEPFDLETKAWRASLTGTTRVIKAVLLDQTIVAGVGNIYADEALYQAKLHPITRACDLTAAQAARLQKAIVSVLKRAIEHRGSTIRNYVGGSGLAGGFQDEFKVYGREGDPCPRCRTAIVNLRVAGRSSHHCPQCQPQPSEKPSS